MSIPYEPTREMKTDVIPTDEHQQLRDAYDKGSLRSIEDALSAFVVKHRKEILVQPSNNGIESGLVCYVLDHHTVITPQADYEDQMREIHNEFWYAGERGEHNRERIATMWIARHAEGWRKHRIRTFYFLLEHNKEHYMTLLKE